MAGLSGQRCESSKPRVLPGAFGDLGTLVPFLVAYLANVNGSPAISLRLGWVKEPHVSAWRPDFAGGE